MLKVITWALLLAGGFNMLALLPQPPAAAYLLDLLRPGAFTIVAGSTAAAAHNRKDLILGVLLLTVLGTNPWAPEDLARLLIPIGFGIMFGGLLRSALAPEQRNESPNR